MRTIGLTPAPARLPGYTIHSVATVLAATDGTDQSDGALRVAMARASAVGAHLSVLTVALAEPIASEELSGALWDEANLRRRDALRDRVDAQLTRLYGRAPGDDVTLMDGNPAFTIARVAIELRAALIVVGLGRHLAVDRLLSDETALQLARISRVPVLAVPADATTAPRHAVVAVDFSELSNRAAQAAVEAVGDEGQVELVHVMPFVIDDAFSRRAKEPYRRWADAQLAMLASQLVRPEGVTVSAVTLHGRPATQLVAHAERVGADLIATGTHGRGFVARSLLGSVTSQLIRASCCAILAVPRDPLLADSTLRREAFSVPGGIRQQQWAMLLAEFTVRNRGRLTLLEEDDLDDGGAPQEFSHPLVLASYDAQEQQLRLMLGDRTSRGRQVSRRISGVSGVDVLTDSRGFDVALRIAHGSRETLLTFAP